MSNKIRNTTAEAKSDPLVTMLTTGFPGGIEAPERAGQRQLVESSVLPTDGLDKLVELYGASGLVRGDVVQGDEMFTHVTLPAGWARQGTDHAMWSYLVDEKGRRRAGIFYKAAFYDRSARVNIERRYRIGQDYSDEVYAKNLLVFTVEEGDKRVLFRTDEVADPVHLDNDRATHHARWDERRTVEKRMEAECMAWLDANRPNHADPLKSWED